MEDRPASPQKKALLIGINRYCNLPDFQHLSGCVNDVTLMGHVLKEHFGFPCANVTCLIDEAATRDGILNAIDDLVAQTDTDDIVVIQYAGHGSQMTDREGDEPDGMDETLVPYDTGRPPAPNREISDDEIYQILLRLTEKTPYVTLIFDCCHSGTMTRDQFGGKTRGIEPDTRSVEELPPSPLHNLSFSEGKRGKGPSGWLPLSSRYTLIAACRHDESAYEYVDPESDLAYGALTFFLCRELVKARSGITYRDVFERLGVAVRANSPWQNPQLEGARDRAVFGISDFTPMRYVATQQRAGRTVQLAAGAAHGLTTGSMWAVYPSGTREITPNLARLGLVKIKTVRAVSSDAKIVEEVAPDAIGPGLRAVEKAHSYGEMRLHVSVRVPRELREKEKPFADLIAASPLLQYVKGEEVAHVCACLVMPRSRASNRDPVPQLQRVPRRVWAVVGTDGRLCMPLHEADGEQSRSRVLANLEKLARFRNALALINEEPDHVLRGKIDVCLWRMGMDGSWIEAEPDETSGEIVYEERARIALCITNSHTEPVYLHVLNFGLLGGISLLHPPPGANEPLAAGRSIEIGTRQGSPMRLRIPDAFPFGADLIDAKAVSGTETIKVFVTSHEADFTPLLQAGLEHVSLRGGASPLGQLLGLALKGTGKRNPVPTEPGPTEQWTTVTRSFTLRCRTAPDRPDR